MAVIVSISLLISCLRMNTEHIFSLRTYADPIHAAPCSEQMAKAVYTAGYGDRHSGFHCLRDCFRGG